ncbi:MAG TPA: hypothetical protein PLD20_16600 [Blastocatellia bacterium]|nr:hypothetical protein [Blastocatellia bacterium]HMZ19558.1 hypothetical protein [Blastocatellia bacterium]HNG29125.1 hypothetical protein [Blastocatellia bacterium]
MIFYIFLRSRARPHGKWLYAGLAVFYDALPHCFHENESRRKSLASLKDCSSLRSLVFSETVS